MLDSSLADNIEEGVAPSTGLTNRRQAEMQPRETPRRYRMTRARASPIAACGQMSACIVHEITRATHTRSPAKSLAAKGRL